MCIETKNELTYLINDGTFRTFRTLDELEIEMANNVKFSGFVGKDPAEFAGGSVVRFTVADTSRWKDRRTGEDMEETTWVDFVCFGETAAYVMTNVKKGALVSVDGRLKNNKRTTPEGQERTKLEVQAFQVELKERSEGAVGGKPQRKVAAPRKPSAGRAPVNNLDDDDQIPF